jgi:hypothetical protein
MSQKIRIEINVKKGSLSGELSFSDGSRNGGCHVEMTGDGLFVHRLEDLDTWTEPEGVKLTREERGAILTALYEHEKRGSAGYYWIRDRQANRVSLPHPLAELIRRCETICDHGCCGIDAFDFSPIHIAAFLLLWNHSPDTEDIQMIGRQLDDLQAGYGSSGSIASGTRIEQINHHFPPGQIDDFVAELRENLAVAVRLYELSDEWRYYKKDALFQKISTFEPLGGDWQPLQSLIAQAMKADDPSAYFHAIFDVFEKHGVENCQDAAEAALSGMGLTGDYEKILLRRYRKKPSAFGRMLLLDITTFGQTHLEGECIADLLAMSEEAGR